MAIHPIGLSLHSKMYAADHTVRNGFQITERQWIRARLAAPPFSFAKPTMSFAVQAGERIWRQATVIFYSLDKNFAGL